MRIKNVFFALLFFIPITVFAISKTWVLDEDIGPAASSSNVIVAAPGASRYNCLTKFTVISDSTYTVRVIDGLQTGTTVYSLKMPANSGVVEDYDLTEPLCGGASNAVQIRVDNGTFSINYKGVIYDSRP